MRIEQRPLDAVTPYAGNPRRIPAAAVRAVAQSIERYGFRQPLVVTAEGVVIVGHARLLAARQLGLDTVPVHVADLTPEQAAAYRLADNRTNEIAEWDDQALSAELTALVAASSMDVAAVSEMTAFDTRELERLLGSSKGESDPDDVPEPPAEPVTKPGDVWSLGRHRLMCGDSASDVTMLLDGATCDLILTDPPYRHEHLGGGGFGAAAMYREGKIEALSDFDLSRYADLFLSAAPMLVAFHSRDLVPDYTRFARSHGRKYDLHVWHKTNAIPFTGHTWKSDVEYIALIWTRKPGWKQLEQHQHSKVYSSPINTDRTHPTTKPIPLLRKYIEILEAQHILDPFAGSGTTIVAAEQLGRACYALEIEPRYVDMAVVRWEAHTGQKAVRA